MWRRTEQEIGDEQLNRLSNEIFRALQVSEAEINSTANSPFLARRLQVRIQAEKERLSQKGSAWFLWLLTARQAIPALGLIAILAAVNFFWVNGNGPNALPNPDAAHVAEVETHAPGVNDMANVSSEEIMATLTGWE